jgi:GNAT superfamily N-acetyltransferase
MNTAADDTALDLDLTYWLEMSEALAYEDTYAAAGSKPGNLTGATTAPVGGAIAFGLTAIDFGFFNRIVGLGTAQPATEADAEAASGFFLDLGVTQSVIHVAPGAEPTELVPWANARGYVKGARWVKMWRHLDEVPVPVPSLRIERIDASWAQVFTDVCVTAFEMPAAIHDLVSATVGRTGWVHYLGFDGDTPVSTSAMHLTDGVAWFGYGGTLDAFRGRGWQSAMFARRLQDARDLGCRLAITETGEETEKIPVNHSYRNMVRVGFNLAYARQNWVRLPENTD